MATPDKKECDFCHRRAPNKFSHGNNTITLQHDNKQKTFCNRSCCIRYKQKYNLTDVDIMKLQIENLEEAVENLQKINGDVMYQLNHLDDMLKSQLSIIEKMTKIISEKHG